MIGKSFTGTRSRESIENLTDKYTKQIKSKHQGSSESVPFEDGYYEDDEDELWLEE